MSENDDLESLKNLIANSHQEISRAVQVACRRYRRSATIEEIDDLMEQVKIHLLENNCQRLRTFNSQQSLFKTWLQSVVNHFVSRQMKKRTPAEPLEETILNRLSYEATQEKEILGKERLAMIKTSISQFSRQEQRIAHLKLREIQSEEIASELKIKPASVERKWRLIKNRLRSLLNERTSRK